MESNHIYEPVNEYDKKYRELQKKNVSDYFENLVKESGVNEEENIETVKEIRKLEKQVKIAENSIKKQKSKRTFLIVIAIISFIIGAVFITTIINESYAISLVADIFITIGLIGLGVGSIFLIVKKINALIKNANILYLELKEKLEQALKLAWQQMESLNNLYDWGMTAEICQKTMPILTLDPYFDSKRYDILHNKYNLVDNSDLDTSVIFSQSGEINGNPFVLGRMVNHYMGNHTYTGTKVIVWTERVRTQRGYTTVTRTQTLTASLSKPKPAYLGRSFLMYGNEAAPNLKFSRTPNNVHKLSKKEIENKVRQGSSKLEKKARKGVVKGGSFTTMSDSEFDVLFGAIDRNNEVQFRLLYTPLAQRETLKIILDNKVGYGDDFEFIKENSLNTIMAKHLDQADIITNPSRYIHFELEESRRIFNEYNNKYFKSLYFAFSPLFAIPLYQQHKPREYIYKDKYESKLSCWEHEAVANGFDYNKLKHPASATFNILKARLKRSKDDVDEVTVTAHGYEQFEEISYVSVMGRDGFMHNVPVKWYRYEPVSKDTDVIIKTADTLKRNEYIKNVLKNQDWQEFLDKNLSEEREVEYRRNIVAYTTKKGTSPASINKLKEMLDR